MESLGRQSMSPATKEHNRDQVEDNIAEMSSMSDSETRAVMEEQENTNRKQVVNSWISTAVLRVLWHVASVADAI